VKSDAKPAVLPGTTAPSAPMPSGKQYGSGSRSVHKPTTGCMTDDGLLHANKIQPISAYGRSIVARKTEKSTGTTTCIASFKKWARLMADQIRQPVILAVFVLYEPPSFSPVQKIYHMVNYT